MKAVTQRTATLVRSLVAASALSVSLLGAVLGSSAQAAVAFTYEGGGLALPDAAGCPPPPAPPVMCNITALGEAAVTSGSSLGPWLFTSIFRLDAPLSPSLWSTSGTFSFDDPGSSNEFFGTLAGAFDFVTLSNTISYVVTGGTGLFSGATGTGTSTVQVTFSASGPPTYIDSGSFSIATVPEPSVLALLAASLFGAALLRRRR